MENVSRKNVSITILVVLAGILYLLYLFFGDNKVPVKQVQPAEPVASAPAPSAQTVFEEPQALPFYDYEVKRGDWLSCLSLERWQDIALDNKLQNPDLIYPGQMLQIRSDIVLNLEKICSRKKSTQLSAIPTAVVTVEVEGRTIGETFIPYCNIGTDPVNPNRVVEQNEREIALTQDYLVTMQTGSGKAVSCVLKQNEVVVADQKGRASWVRTCGNPILNEIFIVDAIPEEKRAEKESIEERRAQFPSAQPAEMPKLKKSRLIILKIFEGGSGDQARSADILHDSFGIQ